MPCDTCDTFTFRTVDIEEIFYFDSYDTDGLRLGWEDFPARMVDGTMYDETLGIYMTAATWISNRIQWCDGNTAPTDRDTTITKVEIRAYSVVANSCGTCTAYIRPVFTDGQGDTHSWLPPGSSEDEIPPAWSVWFDITNDTNAPSTWTWLDVNNLDADHWMVKTVCGNPNGCQTARIEIRVTWHDSVILSGPIFDGLDNRLEKGLKSFNLWEDYAIYDKGIEGQPLVFRGIEIGCEEAIGQAYGACFPLCVPFCFDDIIGAGSYISAAQAAQEKFEKIHNWMENNYNVVLDEFGDCFDAEYAIKNFTVQSMNHPSNYAWKLTLEKVKD